MNKKKKKKEKNEYKKRAHLMNLNARCKLPRRRAVCSSAARANAVLCALTDACFFYFLFNFFQFKKKIALSARLLFSSNAPVK